MLSLLTGALSNLRWQDGVDILLITYFVYRLYVWIQGTRALRIIMALAVLGLLYLLAQWSGLFITSWILQYLWAVILVIAVVIFQSEIRQVLERMSPMRFFLGRPSSLDRLVLEEVVRAAFELAQRRIGALIVFQRRDLLRDFIKGGIPLEGRLSYEVLFSIFLPAAPAHDGAVIIHGGKITAVGCYLPLSDDPGLPRNFGTRHRAGIGITERSDALSLIVSEERGEVSLAVGGTYAALAHPADLEKRLETLLVPDEPPKGRWQESWTANLVPKTVSLALVLVLWIFIAGQQRGELMLTVPLEYRNIPAQMEISGQWVNKVEVGIRGTPGMISSITAEQIRAYIDLSQASPGQNYFRLNPENVRTPLGTEVTQINPATVRLRLEAVKTHLVPVKVKFRGNLPSPLTLQSVTTEPSSVLLQGPESALAKVREVFTEIVDLSVLKQDEKMAIGLALDFPQLRLAPNQAPQVSVEIKVAGQLKPGSGPNEITPGDRTRSKGRRGPA
ncbi:MAG: TIGR00159 family protein [Deltaproteobacteria bacterium]|nr:TIGR00159 family protein [Deltaproteobacteria bacterium]